MNRTTVALPKKLVHELVHVAHQRTNGRAVQWAIEETLRRQKIGHLRSLAGSFRFKKTWQKLRHGDHRLG